MNRKINYIHERALRLVYDDYTASFADLLSRDESVSIHHRNIQKVAIEMFKVKHDLSPIYIKDLFSLRDLRIRSQTSFCRPNVNTTYMGEQSFGPIVWNVLLPEDLKRLTNLEDFKQSSKMGATKLCMPTMQRLCA